MLKNFAQDLKLFRESKGISLNDIYFQTKIHFSNFEKMESGDFNYQPQTYIRAFLRQYARVLELDENEVLRNYDLAKSGKYHPKTRLQEEPKQEAKSSLLSDLFEDKEKSKSAEIVTEVKSTSAKNKVVKVHDLDDSAGQHYITPKSSYYDEPKKNLVQLALKYFGFFLIFAVVVIGIYFLVKIMIPEKISGDKKEIVRQNFDDVVKENEKKMLGKKTPEEIQDSIAKAKQIKDSLSVIASDSAKMTLEVEAKIRGRIIVVSDTLNQENRTVDKLDKGESLSYKANKQFLVTSKEITAFTIKLNGTKIRFEDKNVRNYKINKQTVEKNK